MRYAMILAACLCTPCGAQELPDANPAVQAQLKKTYDAIHRLGIISYDNVEVFQEAQKIKELIAPQDDEDDEVVRLADQVEIMGQLAIFVATTESSENSHVIISWMIWRYLGVSPDATIRVLAPHLDASNVPLREFARDFIQGHDDYEDYKEYVRWKVSRQEEVPAPFVKLLYERSPRQALQVFLSGSVDVAANVQAAIRQLEATGQEAAQKEERESQGRREVLLAEHIVSNALWLHKNGFGERFQAALPEAMAELEKLANHKQWWARLYVVHIMRKNPVLLQDHILRKLAEDENPLVSEAAKSRAARPAPNPGDGRRAEAIVAPREVNARALGPTSGEVTWQASVGATSYAVQRRQPDTETEFTTIAPNVTGTSFIDTGLAKDTLYEYRVIARRNP